MTIKEGQILTANQECKMHFDGRPTLTIGKSYEVIEMDDEDFGVIDDENDTHYFPIKELKLYFTVNQ